MIINKLTFSITNEGDSDSNLFVATDSKGRAIASGRDKSQVNREAHDFLERENDMIQFLATPSIGEVFPAWKNNLKKFL